MYVEEVDERDSSWEVGEPRFRVYLFRPPDMATATYDITGVDVEGAVSWAEQAAGSQFLYSVAVVHDDPPGHVATSRGLIWILGTDANISQPDARARAALDRMWNRFNDAASSEDPGRHE